MAIPSGPEARRVLDAVQGRADPTFKLRKGVKFHDGTPFDAAAVIHVERMLKKDAPQFYPRANGYTTRRLQFLKDVETPDEDTMQDRPSEPYGEWQRMSCRRRRRRMFISPAALKKYGQRELRRAPDGHRSLQVRGERPRREVVHRADFKEYWGPPANVDRMMSGRCRSPPRA